MSKSDSSSSTLFAACWLKLAQMLADHLDGILNYCRTEVRFGVVEAINGNIKTAL